MSTDQEKTKLVIWAKDEKAKILVALAPVLRGAGVDWCIWPDTKTLPLVSGAKLILCLGAEQKEILETMGLIPKKRTVSALRGKAVISELLPCPVLISYTPTIGDIDYGLYVDLLTDVGLGIRYLKNDTFEPKMGSYKYVSNFKDLISQVEAEYTETNKPVEATLDLETIGLDPYKLPNADHPGAYIVTIQLSVKVGESQVLRFSTRDEEVKGLHNLELLEQLDYLLNSPKVSMGGANLKFDLHWLWVRAGIKCTNFKFDTTLVGSLLDENRSNGLDVHVKIYAPELGGYSDQFDKTVDKSRMDLVSPDLLLPYAGGDTDGCLRVRHSMKAELLRDKKLTSFYINLLHPAARAFEIVEQGGVYIDKDKFSILESDLNTEISSLVVKARKLLGGRIIAKHYDPNKPNGLNLTKAALLKDFMFSPMGLNLKPKMVTGKTGAASTALEHLLMFKNVPEAAEFVSLLSEYASATKTLSTYVHGFLNHLRSDGRFHPTYFLSATGGLGGTTCLPASEIILTSRGYIGADAVRVGDEVLSHTGTPRKVLDFIDNGVRPLIKVTLSNGVSLLTTENHPYLTSDGSWIRADQLTSGASVVTYGGLERWAVIEGWPDFSVSSWGRVMNTKTKRLATLYPKGKWGHLKVCLYRNGAQKRGADRKDFPVHRLVAEAFCQKEEDSVEVRHLNGIAWDNNACNLQWGTIKENRQDAVIHGTMSKRGHWQAKLSEEAVAFIRETPVQRGVWTNKKLAEQFGVCTRLIRAVRSGQRWAAKNNSRETNFGVSEVVSIEMLPSQQTYGLTVEGDFSHVTGGVVTHNTGRLSARDPAFQCCKGDSLVYNKDGWTPIKDLVEQYEQGRAFTVMTHTGEWKPVVGVYRNGVKPLLKITTKAGRVLECTDNHPWLTDIGFVQAGKLTVGTVVWGYDEETASGGRIEDRALGGSDGFGGECQGAPKIRRSMRVWDNQGATCSHFDWQEAEQILWLLQVGQIDNAWTQQERAGVCNLLGLATYDETVLRPEGQRVQELWGAGGSSLFFLARLIRELSERHGREACREVVGQAGREWQLRCNKLQVGNSVGASQKSQEQCVLGAQRAIQACQRMGGGVWPESSHVAEQGQERVECDSSPYHASQAKEAGFVEDFIVSIERMPAEETFDLTIEGSHSFVANGVVVHNTLPKHTKWGKRLRACYVAPPGMLVMENDYSQGELRVIACVANDEVMLEAYSRGMDLHVVTGGVIAGYSYEDMLVLKTSDPDQFDHLRQLAKAGNFGLIYGMSAEGFMEYARTSYGVVLNLEQATAFRNGFFSKYLALQKYHTNAKNFARQNGFVRSPLGRIRHLPLINSSRSEVRSGAERQAVNAPIQSALSDMMVWAIALSYQYGWFDTCPCFGQIHDAKYAYIPEDNFDFYVKREIELMENLPLHKLGWKPQLKFIADAKIGKDMGTLCAPEKYGKSK